MNLGKCLRVETLFEAFPYFCDPGIYTESVPEYHLAHSSHNFILLREGFNKKKEKLEYSNFFRTSPLPLKS